jgi:GH24 family phage-related lysozyme (muramidase)
MKVSDKALEVIRHHEGVRTTPYQCPALLWTIGVGHVIDPNHARVPLAERKALPIPDGWNRKITMGEVDDILKRDLANFERGVERYCPVTLTQGQFDALVSFSFNVGLGTLQRSTLRQKVLRGEMEGAADEFLKYTIGGGKVLKGLVTRRNDERAMFVS